jgi:hypothetical protein
VAGAGHAVFSADMNYRSHGRAFLTCDLGLL